jgi:hypothetical protein
MNKWLLLFIFFLGINQVSQSQEDSARVYHIDSTLRIIDLNPYFTLHVDSTLQYQLQINRESGQYFWYVKNAPVGLRINKETGIFSFKADKNLFLSGKLKYDVEYKTTVGIQNLADPSEKAEAEFIMVFYNTEIIPSKVKPTIQGNVWIEEGETASFRILCETGSFPIENILMVSSTPITNYKMVQNCGDEFKWTPSFDLVKESDSAKVKVVVVSFIGTNKFMIRDTANVRFIVKDALNYPHAVEEYNQAAKNVDRYVLQLKYTFLQLDQKLKKNKSARTTFDLTSASTSLTGTVLATSSSAEAQRTGKILPSVGLALVPIKEASVPTRSVDQNQAAMIRSSIKRLEYMRQDNMLLPGKDNDIVKKTNKLKDELKQLQVQLIEVPIELTNDFSEEELNRYFNSPRVNKKYRLKTK